MRRELKFRAWDLITKRVCTVWGIYYKSLDYPPFFVISYVTIGIDGIVERQYPEVVLMQYTGLIDKEYREIYEGDIIMFSSQSIKEYPEDMRIENPFVVQFRNYSWFPFSHGLPMPSDLEIIGNIYQNPELIKVDKNGT